MLFKNFIKKVKEDAPNDLVVRKTRYILYCILLLLIITTLFTIVVIYLGRQATNNISSDFGNYVGGTIGILVLCILAGLWVRGINLLINYFYYVAIINEDSVIKIKFNLFFKEKVEIVELYRILSVYSTQKGVLQGLLNYGSMCMKIQGSGEMLFQHMPKPKLVIAKIEEIKLHTTQERFS